MAWNPLGGQCSRAFDEFRLTMKEVHAFTQLGLRLSREGYEKAYENAEEEATRRWEEREDEDGEPEHPVDIALEGMEGLLPGDFEWMLMAAALRDSVTAFEVYLHKGVYEVLTFAGYQGAEDDAPTWGDLRTLYRGVLLLDIDLSGVKRIRSLRHLLTHQRGELRTKDQREQFANKDEPFFATVAHLDETIVNSACTELINAAQGFDERVWSGAWGPDRANIRGRIESAIKADKAMRRLFSS